MEEMLLDTLKKHRDSALDLERAASAREELLDDDIPEEVQAALFRLAGAMAIEDDLEKCEEFLSEETPEEVTEAYFEARDAIDRTMDDAFAEIERYESASKDFARRVEAFSAGSESSGLLDDLMKLYKCEGLIRMAYRSAKKFPVYGAADSISRMEDEGAATDQERYIMEKMGVDVLQLLEVRARLLEGVRPALSARTAQ